jgi:hypothetical protein
MFPVAIEDFDVEPRANKEQHQGNFNALSDPFFKETKIFRIVAVEFVHGRNRDILVAVNLSGSLVTLCWPYHSICSPPQVERVIARTVDKFVSCLLIS